VRRRAAPAVTRVWSEGTSTPSPEVIDAIAAADVVIIGPSNPYVSIDPILTLDGVRHALASRPVIAVSPIVFGRAIKGPLATMIEQLAGRPPSAAAIADHYHGVISGIVTESGDETACDVPVLPTKTVMHCPGDRTQLARDVLGFAKVMA
jgi:LPPG:FO 2-phospho-L-lactate transferase